MPSRVPAHLAAYAADVQPATLRTWVNRGHISPPDHDGYDLGEITAWIDRRNPARARALRIRHARSHETPILASQDEVMQP